MWSFRAVSSPRLGRCKPQGDIGFSLRQTAYAIVREDVQSQVGIVAIKRRQVSAQHPAQDLRPRSSASHRRAAGESCIAKAASCDALTIGNTA